MYFICIAHVAIFLSCYGLHVETELVFLTKIKMAIFNFNIGKLTCLFQNFSIIYLFIWYDYFNCLYVFYLKTKM